MATSKPEPGGAKPRRRGAKPEQPGPTTLKRGAARHGRGLLWAARGLAVLGLGGLAVLGLHASRFGAEARLGAAYGAHVACACHFIAGRPLSDCARDFEPGMGLVTLSADEDSRSITARVIPLASQTATWRAGQGCVLEAWR